MTTPTELFETWWQHTGSAITPLPVDDMEKHAERIARLFASFLDQALDTEELQHIENVELRILTRLGTALRERDEARGELQAIADLEVSHAN